MLIIRDEQLLAFTHVHSDDLLALVFGHVNDVFPDECSEMSDAENFELIHYGIEVAAFYRITNEICICFFLDLIFILGSDFDVNLEYPWARSILLDLTLDEGEKIDLLFTQLIATEEYKIRNDSEFCNE